MHRAGRHLAHKSHHKDACAGNDERQREQLSHIKDHSLLEAHLRLLDELDKEPHPEASDEEEPEEEPEEPPDEFLTMRPVPCLLPIELFDDERSYITCPPNFFAIVSASPAASSPILRRVLSKVPGAQSAVLLISSLIYYPPYLHSNIIFIQNSRKIP